MEIQMAGALHRFQDGFARALLAPDAGAGCAAELADLVRQPGFAVYRNTVMKGCIDALRTNFPSVARLVGEDWFRAAAAIYVRAHPPRHAVLMDYGAEFAGFLAGFEPAAELPYLPGVARLDRFWSEAHAARDEAPVNAAAVVRLAPAELARSMLHPHASARWAWFDDQPIYTIWRRNREQRDDAAEIEWRAQGALLVRPRDAVAWIELNAAGCAFLDACADGRRLAEAAAASLAADPSADLVQLMAMLLEAGAFGRMTVHSEELNKEQR